jgi:myo-inositol-1(or 4)-monophosphatase
VEEAGGKVTNHENEPFSIYQHKILATNGKIHDELSGIITNKIAI